MNLFVRICRFLSDILTRSSPPAPVYDLSCITKQQLLELSESNSKEDLFGSVVSILEEVLLFRLPYHLYRLKNGAKLEDVSLSIPGKEKRIETDETLTITLDLEIKDYKTSSYSLEWDRDLNAVFINAIFEPMHSPEYPSPRILNSIDSRINLGNDVLYKTTYDYKLQDDGVLIITFYKNAPPVPKLL